MLVTREERAPRLLPRHAERTRGGGAGAPAVAVVPPDATLSVEGPVTTALAAQRAAGIQNPEDSQRTSAVGGQRHSIPLAPRLEGRVALEDDARDASLPQRDPGPEAPEPATDNCDPRVHMMLTLLLLSLTTKVAALRPPSPAPTLINALSTAAASVSDPDLAAIVKAVDVESLTHLIETLVVENAPWVAKYGEQGRFGLPLDSQDPLVKLQRAECVLALHLILHHEAATVPGTDRYAPLSPSDFIDPDRLQVLLSASNGGKSESETKS
ncbi:hypothetical protein CTAYLR_004330 [Chrysophaeum taylorii]|uniref:Uncharacterized protein n=1 Tax=Chrysophaeum taylorii TaxID=2483200 RepID=A0AAD7XQA7_9STRA|nr:hypothetical protein CTAYLR_004330 [Chrysophaeum taylorii]